MTVKFYAYPKCSTCRKAQTFLNQKKRAYEAIDITLKPPGTSELKSMLIAVGGDLRRLFNTSGKTYREMQLGAKLGSLSEGEALKLLASDGKLIKRPFLMIDGKGAAVGFKEQEWKKIRNYSACSNETSISLVWRRRELRSDAHVPGVRCASVLAFSLPYKTSERFSQKSAE